jgi:hypothetical protein
MVTRLPGIEESETWAGVDEGLRLEAIDGKDHECIGKEVVGA